MAIKFYAPGIKIREIDMSIVPPIVAPNITQLFFINSHWGSDKPVLIEGGQQEFITNFGFPDVPETDYVKWLSWDAQFKYASYGKCLVVRQNQNGDKAGFKFNNDTPFMAKYQGTYGNSLKLKIINTIAQNSIASEIQVLEKSDDTEYVLESKNINIQFVTKSWANTHTITVATNTMTINMNKQHLMPRSIVLKITDGTHTKILTDNGQGKLYLNDTIFFNVNYETGVLTLTHDYTSEHIIIGDMDFESHTELKTAISESAQC